MSYKDFIALIDRVFRTPVLGCSTIRGVSGNDRSLWNNTQIHFLGWKPRDNAQHHRIARKNRRAT